MFLTESSGDPGNDTAVIRIGASQFCGQKSVRQEEDDRCKDPYSDRRDTDDGRCYERIQYQYRTYGEQYGTPLLFDLLLSDTVDVATAIYDFPAVAANDLPVREDLLQLLDSQ